MRQTRGRVLAGLVIGLIVAGLFLAYDASRHAHSTYDVSITQYVQSWNTPGLSPFLNIVSELTNFYPAVAIWTATFVLFFWRGLRVGFYSVVGSGDLFRNGSPFRLCGPAASIPRPGPCIAIPDWKQLPQRPRLWSGRFLRLPERRSLPPPQVAAPQVAASGHNRIYHRPGRCCGGLYGCPLGERRARRTFARSRYSCRSSVGILQARRRAGGASGPGVPCDAAS